MARDRFFIPHTMIAIICAIMMAGITFTLLGEQLFAQDDTSVPTAPATIRIDEVSVDPNNSDLLGLITLADGRMGSTPLSGLALVIFNQPTDEVEVAYDLSDQTTDADGYFTLGINALTPPPDLVLASPLPLAVANTAALIRGNAADYPAGAIAQFDDVLELVRFGLDAAGDLNVQVLIAAADVAPLAAVPMADVVRDAEFAAAPVCGEPATLIHDVQGAGMVSDMIGQAVSVEGIVAGDFQDAQKGLRGFFMQEEVADQDAIAATSEGLFIYDAGKGVNVLVGDQVRVEGEVGEFNGLTELKRLSGMTVCSRDNIVTPLIVTLPATEDTEFERYEGMLISIDTPMTVAQNYFLGRYGQMTLSAGGRLFQPTNLFPPDSVEAQATLLENRRRMIVLDDGQDLLSFGDNPNPVPYLGAPPPAAIRAGDSVTGLIGILDQGRINSAPKNEVGLGYRLQPTVSPQFSAVNERASAPVVGGALKVASFNVLNYFNGDGEGGDFPTSRGAATAADFDRQRTKIITAILGLDADVVGLMEIENDGFGPNSAIQDLVNGLNANAADGQTYAYIDPGVDLFGGDEIKVGLLYRPATVTPVGAAATLDNGAFGQPMADGGSSRQPLAQTFADAAGERFTVVVNHFKSKRPSGAPGAGDGDAGDGAGAWNQRRTEAAQQLTAWLASDPTASGDPDFLIIGDLNAYAKEDPVAAIEDAGYQNLLEVFNANEAYSYVFDGQAGYLDHALASTTLAEQATGAADWHINADEPKVIDYESRFNPPGYYSPDAFRASDHDPVLIGLALTSPAVTEPITITEPLTPTEPVTITEPLTPTQPVTITEPVTVTEPVTITAPVTPTAPVTITEPITTTEPLTPTAPVITTEPTVVTPNEAQATTYVVQYGDNLSSIARRFNTTVGAVAAANNLSRHRYLRVGQVLKIPPGAAPTVCREQHIVQRGETLATIAAQYGLRYGQLAAVNGIANPNLIRVGKKLCIPQ